MPLLLIYPVLAHLAVLQHDARLQWLSLLLIGAAPLWEPLRKLKWRAWCAIIALGAALYVVVSRGGGIYALFLPPILIPLALLILFAKTLGAGAEPMITRIARTMRGSLEPELERYTRSVTNLWVAMFAALTLSATALALWATPAIWSLGTNLVHYLAIGGLFAAEYAYRRWRFRHLPQEGLVRYFRRLVKVKFRAP